MYRFITIATFVLLLFGKAEAQSFTNSNRVFIPDNTLVFSNISVNGLPSSIDSSNFGLISVCVNIQHGFVGQLDLLLQSPTGLQVQLCNNRGSNGINFSNTCFAMNGSISIANGAAPFIGTFIPERTLNALNNGQNPNGVWRFGVRDEIPFNTGWINSVTLNFGANPPPTPIFTTCSIFGGGACKCPDGSQNCDLLPDMTNSTEVIRTLFFDEPGVLNVGIGTPNIGFGPLEVRGTGECFCDTIPVADPNIPCPNGDYPKEKIIQRVFRKVGNIITSYDRAAGFMQFHPGHGHMHIDNWTSNTLRIKGPNPNPLTWPIVGRDSKLSFCLVNNYNCSQTIGYCRDSLGNPITHAQTGNPGLGAITGCGREQGIFPGYLDIYFPGYEGQILRVDSNTACNGVYYVVSQTDPDNHFLELNENNNIAFAPVYMAFQKSGDCCTTGFYADTLNGEAPFRVQFIDTTKPSSKQWFWDFGDGTTDTTQFPVHVYTKPGNYKVTLKTVAEQTNCTSTLSKDKYIQVKPKLNAGDVIAANVYPNPFNNYLNVYYKINEAALTSIKIFDVTGRTVFETTPIQQNAGTYDSRFMLAHLKEGVYIVKINAGKFSTQYKVVKTNK